MIRTMAVTALQWASTSARSLMAQLRGAGETGSDDSAEAHDEVEIVQPIGLRAHPVVRDSLEAFAVTRGDERIALFLVDKGRRAGGVEPEAGGLVLHGLAEESAVIYIRASGDIEITPKTGRDVVLAGGSLNAARSSDAVQVTLDVTAVGGITAPPGGGPCTLTTGAVTLSGSITGTGAPHVKA